MMLGSQMRCLSSCKTYTVLNPVRNVRSLQLFPELTCRMVIAESGHTSSTVGC